MKASIQNLFGGSVLLISPEKIIDNRGFFFENYCKKFFKEIGIYEEFIQENISYSKKTYTFRGIHLQTYPKSQSKLVTVLKGKILDIVFDFRKSSKTFGQHIKLKLFSNDSKYLYIPKGFVHAFCTLEPNTIVSYKVSEHYSPKNEKTISVFDKNLNLKLGISKNKLILSSKDRNGMLLNDFIKFKYK